MSRKPTGPVTLRPEQPGDEAAIHALTDAAFGNVDDESAVIDRLRQSDRWIADLSIVAGEERRRIIGTHHDHDHRPLRGCRLDP